MSRPSTPDELRTVVAGVVDPIYDRRLGELRLIKNVSLDGNRAAVQRTAFTRLSEAG